MTWLDRNLWAQMVKELWPLIVFVILMVLLFVVFVALGCQPQPCLPEQASLWPVEQPTGCDAQLLDMKQVTYIQAGPPPPTLHPNP